MEHNTVRIRKEVPEEYTWDLTSLYPDTGAWEEEFAMLDAKAEAFNAFKGRAAGSPAVLRQALEKEDELALAVDRLYCYAHLRADEDTRDSGSQQLLERIRGKYAALAGSIAWFEPELAAVPRDVWQEFCQAPELAPYSFALRELARAREHVLSDSEERILGLLSETLNAPGHIFSLLSNADMKFKAIRDSSGTKRKITHGSYSTFLEDKNREIRRKAFKSMFSAHKDLEHTMAAVLAANVNTHYVNASIRNFPSALSAALFEDEIPESVYHGLVTAVNNNLAHLHRYLEIRRRVLDVEKLDIYDLYVPLQQQKEMNFSFEDARKLITGALAPMGDDYIAVLNRAFDERWIDLPETEGKRSGAYSSGCYGSNPYILTNFHGSLDDVFTLAHELGHSMHSWYSRQEQPYRYSEYSIFAAEIASITNEMLLFRHLEKMYGNTDRDFALYLCVHLAEQFRTTMYRQTMFAEFELAIHRMAEAGTPLVAETLNAAYYELKSRYTGPAVKNSKLVEVEWARIPHFYYNFYVYKYATGLAAAVQASEMILSGNKDAVMKYKKFLAAGCSKPVLDILSDAGLTFTDGSCVEASLQVFAANVNKLAKLTGEC